MATVAVPIATTAIPAAGTVAVYTVPTSYVRDIILTNPTQGGTAFTVWVGNNSSMTVATGIGIPANGQIVLEGPPGPVGTIFYATSVSAATLVVGAGSVVSVI